MKSLLLAFLLTVAYSGYAQRVGINSPIPAMQLHVTSTDSAVLLLSNSKTLADSNKTALYFSNNGLYTGAIKTQITSADNLTARMGLFTYSTYAPNNIKESMSITDDGNVGIGIVAPVAKLDVLGTIKIKDGTQGLNKVLTSDANGLASWQAAQSPAGFKFCATQGGGISIPVAAYTQMPFVNENYDADNAFASGTFTVPATGIYHINVDVPGSGILMASNGYMFMELRANGTAIRRAHILYTVSQVMPTLTINGDVSLTAGNTLQVYLFQNGGAPISLGGSTADFNPHFSSHRIY